MHGQTPPGHAALGSIGDRLVEIVAHSIVLLELGTLEKLDEIPQVSRGQSGRC